MKRFLDNWLNIIFILSLIATVVALIAEYFFNLIPCNMCLKQRYPYYVIILIITLFYIFPKLKNIWSYLLIEISIIYGLFYSIWHVSVEQKILKSPASCSGTLSKTNSIQNLKEQITNQAMVSCSDINWVILGFSAATINSILLLFILIFNSMYIINSIYDKKKI